MSSIHGTTYGLTNCILDMYGSEQCDDVITEIREECERVSAACDGIESKSAVARLRLIDSWIRESLRFSGFTIMTLMRVVG